MPTAPGDTRLPAPLQMKRANKPKAAEVEDCSGINGGTARLAGV